MYYVDLPKPDNIDGKWVNIETFETREEAIEFIKEKFGGDENGMIGLVSWS